MLFNSFEFAIFLPIVLAVYYLLSRRAQNVFLLAASYLFYGWWDWRFLGLIAASTLLDFTCGLLLERETRPSRRRMIMWISVAGNLGALGVFKYYNFFLDSFIVMAGKLGFDPHLSIMQIVLPVGISFYTFQTMSYTLDVYRRQFEPVKNFIDFALFVCYFPQLVAGPIERASNLLPQIQSRREVKYDQIVSGLYLILLGLFKKVVIADNVAVLADWAFSNPSDMTCGQLWGGLYAFSIQIYCDFSGYSDIARGCSRLMGIELMRNFNQPYLSLNITEFWRRWHISLSFWLRDYLYIPLGGNQKGPQRTYINLMATMLLGGLWHGASWTFVVWGGLHGLFLSVHKWMRGGDRRICKPDFASIGGALTTIAKVVMTFHLASLTWIFFRAKDFGVAMDYLIGMARWSDGLAIGWGVTAALLALLAIDLPQRITGEHGALMKLKRPYSMAIAIGMGLAIVYLGAFNETPFIYFQF